MENISEKVEGRTYYVHGSGLIPVPPGRIHEIAMLRSESHAEEAKRAILLARFRKLS